MSNFASIQDFYADNVQQVSQASIETAAPNALTSMLFGMQSDAAAFDQLMFAVGIKNLGAPIEGLDKSNTASLIESAQALGYEVELVH